MRKKDGRSLAWLWGAVIFFFTVAFIIQVAILLYEYIIAKTQSKGLIAVLMLIVVIALSLLCTVVDAVRRKIMVDMPTERILKATERMAKGDFTVRLRIDKPYDKYDSYDKIMDNVNVLAAELGKSEVLKTDFIANISHELKTPLAVLKNYAKLLEDPSLEEETKHKYLQTIQNATGRLNNLIGNVLKLNKLEHQELKEQLQTFDLTEALAQAVLAFEDSMERKRLQIDCRLEDVKIYSAPSLLGIVWSNLLSNAIKFTEEGGEIWVSLRRVEDTAEIRVRDNGCGISPEVGSRIFEKFYQGDTSHSGEGNGLGLALVKKVIDILGGKISVESEPGKGSTFTVVLYGAESK